MWVCCEGTLLDSDGLILFQFDFFVQSDSLAHLQEYRMYTPTREAIVCSLINTYYVT